MLTVIFKISGKMPCSNDWFRIRVKGITKTLMLSLIIVTGILVGPRAFRLFNWDVSFRTSSWVRGVIMKIFEFLSRLRDTMARLDKLWPVFVKILLKALAIFLGFGTFLRFTLIILNCLLLLYFNVVSCRIPFQIKDISFLFFSK